FLAERIGARFMGRVSGITRSGLFIRLLETGADGFIPASTLGQDYYRYVDGRQSMVGERSGETFTLGDRGEVGLLEAGQVAGALRFELLSEGKRGNPPSGKRLRKGAARSFGPKGRRKR